MARRPLPWVVLLAAALHLVGIARTDLPAQDGLKFIRVARSFHERPWVEVIRGTDQHPLYPVAIAAAQPIIAPIVGHGPDSWRIAAQGVSAIASLALLFPLFGLTRAVFDARTANLACLIYVLLPIPAEVGHDTLSDPLALLAFAFAMSCGVDALRDGRLRSALGCGIAGGLGYLARPEVTVVPMAVLLTAATQWVRPAGRRDPRADVPSIAPHPRFAALALATLLLVGAYAALKGEVSEKLALRKGIALGPSAAPKSGPRVKSGLEHPRLDFSAKEESGHASRVPARRAAAWIVSRWVEDLGWFFPVFVAWGIVRVRADASAKRLALIFAAIFGLILLRHATTLGYLSNRHMLTLAWLSIPWAAAGMMICATRAGGWFRPPLARGLAVVLLSGLIAVGVGAQLNTPHASRSGHRAAGRWLAAHAGAADGVMDTRGWAAFVSGRRDFYDYWHVRQALKDEALRYVVVGADELAAPSRRAATLRAWLAFAATPLVAFPGRTPAEEVRIYRFRRPESWEGLRP